MKPHCDICNKTYASASSLCNHKRRMHSGVNDIQSIKSEQKDEKIINNSIKTDTNAKVVYNNCTVINMFILDKNDISETIKMIKDILSNSTAIVVTNINTVETSKQPVQEEVKIDKKIRKAVKPVESPIEIYKVMETPVESDIKEIHTDEVISRSMAVPIEIVKTNGESSVDSNKPIGSDKVKQNRRAAAIRQYYKKSH